MQIAQILQSKTTNDTNDVKQKNTNGSNDTNGEKYTLEQYKKADAVADELVQTFGAPQSRKFFCKVAYALPYKRIMQLASIARCDAKTNPGGYFNVIARREMGQL